MFKEIKEELTGSKEQIIDYGTFTLAIIAIIITSLKASEGVIPAVDVGYVAAAVIILSQTGSAIRLIIQFETIQTLKSQLAAANDKLKSLVSK